MFDEDAVAAVACAAKINEGKSMQMKTMIRKSAELGIALVAVSALLLIGCGGGAKSNAVGANSNVAIVNATCNLTGDSTGATAVACLVDEMLTAGYGAIWLQLSSPYMASEKLVASGVAGTYSLSVADSALNLAQTAWSPLSAVATAWYLTPQGWVSRSSATPFTLQNDGNGMLSVTDISSNYTLSSVVKTDLSNKPVICTTGASAVACSVPQNYPNNAFSYDMNKTYTSDTYYLYDTGRVEELTDANGVALTALPALDSIFCMNGVVYNPILPTPAAGLANYDQHAGNTILCTQAAITTKLASAKTGTAAVSHKTVQGVSFMATSSSNIAAFNTQSNNRFMTGYMSQMNGRVFQQQRLNKAAANTRLAANALPVLP